MLSRDSYLSIKIPVGPLKYRLVSGGWLPRKGLLHASDSGVGIWLVSLTTLIANDLCICEPSFKNEIQLL